MRFIAAQIIHNEPDSGSGERGVIINTVSAAAFDGQRGQAAYAASKGAIASLSLPVARDLAELAIRCVAIAPGLFESEMAAELPDKALQGIERALLYPARKGVPAEFASPVRHIVENPYLNGTSLQLDGAARLPAR